MSLTREPNTRSQLPLNCLANGFSSAMGKADTEAAVQAFGGLVGRFILISSCDVYPAYRRLTKNEKAAMAKLATDMSHSDKAAVQR